MKINRIVIVLLMLLVMMISGCKAKSTGLTVIEEEKKINIIATTFPQFEFAKNIVGDKGNVTLLLSPGLETHSFEPSPKDIINISKCDIFIYTGGEGWVDEVLSAMDTNDLKAISLMEIVHLLEEEVVEGMVHNHEHHEGEDEHHEEAHEHHDGEDDHHEEAHEHHEDEDEYHGEEHGYDEHVWMSPKNAIEIVTYLEDEIIAMDDVNKTYYTGNAEKYIDELSRLDDLFVEVTRMTSKDIIVVADRFPFRYLVETYGLSYYAAFTGCSTQTDASPATVAFLIDTVKANDLPVVFYTEQSNQLLADTVSESTGAKKLLLHSCHNVSREEIEAGVTYISLMTKNAETLKEALQ